MAEDVAEDVSSSHVSKPQFLNRGTVKGGTFGNKDNQPVGFADSFTG